MRILNRLLAALFGLALAATGLFIVLEVAAALTGRAPALLPYDRWLASVRAYRWSSPEVLWVSAGLLGGSLALMMLQLTPRRPEVLHTAFEIPRIDVEVDRSSLERSLARAATSVEGVRQATGRARKKRIRATVEIFGEEDGKVTEAVRRALGTRLEELRVIPLPDIEVTARALGRVR